MYDDRSVQILSELSGTSLTESIDLAGEAKLRGHAISEEELSSLQELSVYDAGARAVAILSDVMKFERDPVSLSDYSLSPTQAEQLTGISSENGRPIDLVALSARATDKWLICTNPALSTLRLYAQQCLKYIKHLYAFI